MRIQSECFGCVPRTRAVPGDPALVDRNQFWRHGYFSGRFNTAEGREASVNR